MTVRHHLTSATKTDLRRQRVEPPGVSYPPTSLPVRQSGPGPSHPVTKRAPADPHPGVHPAGSVANRGSPTGKENTEHREKAKYRANTQYRGLPAPATPRAHGNIRTHRVRARLRSGRLRPFGEKTPTITWFHVKRGSVFHMKHPHDLSPKP